MKGRICWPFSSTDTECVCCIAPHPPEADGPRGLLPERRLVPELLVRPPLPRRRLPRLERPRPRARLLRGVHPLQQQVPLVEVTIESGRLRVMNS